MLFFSGVPLPATNPTGKIDLMPFYVNIPQYNPKLYTICKCGQAVLSRCGLTSEYWGRCFPPNQYLDDTPVAGNGGVRRTQEPAWLITHSPHNHPSAMHIHMTMLEEHSALGHTPHWFTYFSLTLHFWCFMRVPLANLKRHEQWTKYINKLSSLTVVRNNQLQEFSPSALVNCIEIRTLDKGPWDWKVLW